MSEEKDEKVNLEFNEQFRKLGKEVVENLKNLDNESFRERKSNNQFKMAYYVN